MKKRWIVGLAVGLFFCGFSVIAEAAGVDSNTVLMIHSDTFNGDTAFVDSSPAGHTVENSSGSVYHSTNASVFGNSSIYFDESHSDHIFLPESNDWNLSSGDFTIDFWLNVQTLGSFSGVMHDPLITTINGDGWQIYYDAATKALDVWEPDTGSHFTAWEAVADTWYHLALIESNNIMTWYIDGQSIGIVPAGATMDNDGNPLAIGDFVVGSHPVFPHLFFDEIRISKGVARWTENFTPLNAPYSPVPIPGAVWLLGSGLAGLVGMRWKVKKGSE